MKLSCNNSIYGALCLRDFLARFAFLPFPNADCFLCWVVNRKQKCSTVSLTKADTSYCSLKVTGSDDCHSCKRNRIPYTNVRRSNSPILTSALTSRYQKFIRMNSQALDIISVTQVMTLRLFIDVVENDSRRNEVDNFACWKLIQVWATVFASIAIDLKWKQRVESHCIDVQSSFFLPSPTSTFCSAPAEPCWCRSSKGQLAFQEHKTIPDGPANTCERCYCLHQIVLCWNFIGNDEKEDKRRTLERKFHGCYRWGFVRLQFVEAWRSMMIQSLSTTPTIPKQTLCSSIQANISTSTQQWNIHEISE